MNPFNRLVVTACATLLLTGCAAMNSHQATSSSSLSDIWQQKHLPEQFSFPVSEVVKAELPDDFATITVRKVTPTVYEYSLALGSEAVGNQAFGERFPVDWTALAKIHYCVIRSTLLKEGHQKAWDGSKVSDSEKKLVDGITLYATTDPESHYEDVEWKEGPADLLNPWLKKTCAMTLKEEFLQ